MILMKNIPMRKKRRVTKMIKCENNKVIMEGTGYELLNEYSAIHKEMVLEFGPDTFSSKV